MLTLIAIFTFSQPHLDTLLERNQDVTQTAIRPIEADLVKQKMVAISPRSRKVGVTGLNYLPHVPVNDQFLSTIILRNDNLDMTIDILAGFFDEDGNGATVQFRIGNTEFNSNGFQGPISALTNLAVHLESASERSVQLVMISRLGNIAEDPTDDLDMEIIISRYSNGDKTAIVGLGAPKPARAFRFNFLTERDSITLQRNLRGFAIMNSTLDPCSCEGVIADIQGRSQSIEFNLPPLGKELGLLSDLAPGFNLNTATVGQVIILCTEEVSTLGLQFEGDAMGGVALKREL